MLFQLWDADMVEVNADRTEFILKNKYASSLLTGATLNFNMHGT